MIRLSVPDEETATASEPGPDAIDLMADGYFEMDAGYRYRRVNRAALRLAGMAAEEILGRHVLEVFPEVAQAAIHQTTMRVMETREPDSVETYYPPYQRWYVNSIYPIADGLAILTRDITNQKLLEQHLAFLAEAGDILAASLDYELELERLAHLTVPALADWCVIDLLGDDGALHRLAVVHRDPDRADAAAELKRRYPTLAPDQPHRTWDVLPEGPPFFDPEVEEERFIRQARDPEHLALLRRLGFAAEMVLPLVARGRPLGVMTLVLSDRSRRYEPRDLALAQELARRAAIAIDNARLYQDAQDAIRSRDEFLSIAAHELRNPVTVLKGAADLLRRPIPDPNRAAERQERLLEQMAKAANRLVELTDDLLDISRIQLGQLALRRDWLDANALIGDIGERYRERLGSGTRLMLDLPEAPCRIEADAGRLEQVLINLFDNALKYSPHGGCIEVRLRPDDSGASIAVRDEGIGLPPGAEETIFEPFGRAANTSAIPGMGLGLFICRNIIEQHGGRIWAESAGEGHGTTISLWLPGEVLPIWSPAP
jgi:PAS domain S-box-containing protein